MMNEKEYEERFGCAPVQDDLERVNCPHVGTLGHLGCGVCGFHDQPRFMCGCDSSMGVWDHTRQAIKDALKGQALCVNPVWAKKLVGSGIAQETANRMVFSMAYAILLIGLDADESVAKAEEALKGMIQFAD